MLHLTWPLVLSSGLGSFSLPKHRSASRTFFFFSIFFLFRTCSTRCTSVLVRVGYCLKQISCVVVCFGFSFFFFLPSVLCINLFKNVGFFGKKKKKRNM